jgi:hypothetical protein
MKLEDLKELLESGRFHHATYRNHGTLWEGLWIYEKDKNGFRGFSLVGAFGKDSPDLEAAENMVRGTGVSFGAYGEG